MKQEEKRIQSRKKILEVAEELFSQKSIDEVGLREICAMAGVTTGTLYYHFSGKNEIIDQIYRKNDDDFAVIIQQMEGKPPYCQRIVEFFSDTLAKLVERDGIDFTMHRYFQLKKHSSDSDQLYIGVQKLIGLAMEHQELDSDCSVKEVNDFLFLVFRGIVYEWCIAEASFSLGEKVREAELRAIRAFLK